MQPKQSLVLTVCRTISSLTLVVLFQYQWTAFAAANEAVVEVQEDSRVLSSDSLADDRALPPAQTGTPLPAETTDALEQENDAISPSSADKVATFLDFRKRKLSLPSYVRDQLSEEDLPALYDALNNEAFARQWSRVLFAICVLDDDEKAFETVKHFVSTPWNRSKSEIHGHEAKLVIRGITTSVGNLAMLDPALSSPFLREIFTRDGAERFLEAWNGYSFPEAHSESLLVNDLMFSAAAGLLYTRVPENIKIIDDKYRELDSIPQSDRTDAEWETIYTCRRIMGSYMLYQEMGWDEGIKYVHGLDTDGAIAEAGRGMARYMEHVAKTRGD